MEIFIQNLHQFFIITYIVVLLFTTVVNSAYWDGTKWVEDDGTAATYGYGDGYGYGGGAYSYGGASTSGGGEINTHYERLDSGRADTREDASVPEFSGNFDDRVTYNEQYYENEMRLFMNTEEKQKEIKNDLKEIKKVDKNIIKFLSSKNNLEHFLRNYKNVFNNVINSVKGSKVKKMNEKLQKMEKYLNNLKNLGFVELMEIKAKCIYFNLDRNLATDETFTKFLKFFDKNGLDSKEKTYENNSKIEDFFKNWMK